LIVESGVSASHHCASGYHLCPAKRVILHDLLETLSGSPKIEPYLATVGIEIQTLRDGDCTGGMPFARFYVYEPFSIIGTKMLPTTPLLT
jgi:hypothetical protein